MSLCGSVGDGKWRLPSNEELCGPNYDVPDGQSCQDRFYDHEIGNVPFAGGDWTKDFWSSSPLKENTIYAWTSRFSDPVTFNALKASPKPKVLCVR